MTITAPKRSEKNLVGRDDEGRQAQSSCDKLGGQSTYDKLGGQISATNSVAGNNGGRPLQWGRGRPPWRPLPQAIYYLPNALA